MKMKKSILNIGQALNKTEQKDIFGGSLPSLCGSVPGNRCSSDEDCCYPGGSCQILSNDFGQGHITLCV